jgi:hypothetical protein
MQKALAIAACAAVLSMGLITEAEARGRSWNGGGSFKGPYGGVTTWQRSGQCSGGTCTGSKTTTGPGGRTWTRERSVTGTGNGGWTSNGKATGPRGGSWTRSGGGSCAGGTCTYGGTVTGPNGNTGSYSGSFTRGY